MLEYLPGSGNGGEALETIQAAMLELVLPVLPHRLNDDWRKVIEQMDLLDMPGMRAGRQGASRANGPPPIRSTSRWRSSSAARWPTSSSATPRRCRSRRCCCLSRGGNLEVTAQMKYQHRQVGQGPLRRRTWPHAVHDEMPALFIGMTGIDEEFRNREEYADKMLYERRLGQLADALGNVMSDFGGQRRPSPTSIPSAIPAPGTPTRGSARRVRSGGNGNGPARRSSNRANW